MSKNKLEQMPKTLSGNPLPFQMSHPGHLLKMELESRYGSIPFDRFGFHSDGGYGRSGGTILSDYGFEQIKLLADEKVNICDYLANLLDDVLGISKDFWLNLQKNYDSYLIDREYVESGGAIIGKIFYLDDGSLFRYQNDDAHYGTFDWMARKMAFHLYNVPGLTRFKIVMGRTPNCVDIVVKGGADEPIAKAIYMSKLITVGTTGCRSVVLDHEDIRFSYESDLQ